MKTFLPVVVLLLLHFVFLVEGGRFNLDGSQKMTIKGNAQVKLNPAETMWVSLSKARRFPIIYSGDLIALRRATTSGTAYWLRCHKSSDCDQSTCPGKNVMLASKWSACQRVVFKIRAMGKYDGQPIDSGDTVALSFPYHRHSSASRGYEYYLYCGHSNTYKCRANWGLPPIVGNRWFLRAQAIFRIFSRNAVDGTPVQLADIVGFQYPFYAGNTWLYYAGGKFYARPCNYSVKNVCAKANAPTGFQIFKKI